MFLFQAMREALPDLPEDVLSSDFFPPAGDLKTITNLLLDFIISGICTAYPLKRFQ